MLIEWDAEQSKYVARYQLQMSNTSGIGDYRRVRSRILMSDSQCSAIMLLCSLVCLSVCLSVCGYTGDEGHVGCDRAVLPRERSGDHDGLRGPQERRVERICGHFLVAGAATRPAHRPRRWQDEEAGEEEVREIPLELDGVHLQRAGSRWNVSSAAYRLVGMSLF